LLSATDVQRQSDRQQLNRYFLQNWRDRPTRVKFESLGRRSSVSRAVHGR